jgi:hypothetical protein
LEGCDRSRSILFSHTGCQRVALLLRRRLGVLFLLAVCMTMSARAHRRTRTSVLFMPLPSWRLRTAPGGLCLLSFVVSSYGLLHLLVFDLLVWV